MNEKYDILVKKLDDFIRKFYLNRIVKGIFLSLSVYAIWYLLIVIAEYFGRFSTNFRTLLIFVTGLSFLVIFVWMIVIPILKLFKIGKTLSYRGASKLLGQHFPDVADKLQNTLELQELANQDPEFSDIIIASINQRTEKLRPVPFVSAINIKKNFKYLKYLGSAVIVFVLILIVWPSVISDATERIINFDKHYEVPAPYEFTILNDSLVVKKGQNFTLEVEAKGEYSPDQLVLNYGGNEFYMEKKSPGVFQYNFKNLNNNIDFNLSTPELESSKYSIAVLPAPVILDFEVYVNPPAYTGIENKKYKNSGDINVPIGSQVSWSFSTANLNSLSVVFDSLVVPAIKTENHYNLKKQILKSGVYSLVVENDFFKESTGISYQVNVTPDLYPTINVKDIIDTVQLSIMYFNGFIDDDYGFSNLTFNCIPGEDSDTLIRISVPFSKRISSQDFYYAFDFSSLETAGRKISYYFEVSDNDGVHGAKTSRTRTMEFMVPTADDLQDMSDETNDATEEKIDEAKEISAQIRKDIEELEKKLINEQMTSWERNQMMNQIMENQQRLENLMDEISKEQSDLQKYKEQFSKNEEILQKQEEINKLMESIMDEEMKKLMEELQKLMEEFNKDEFFKVAEDMKFNSEEMEKELDNTLELLKKTEVEERIKNAVDKLDDLAKEHEELSKETKEKNLSKEELQKKLDEHQEEFEEITKDYEETLEKNSDLEEPMDLDDFKEEMEEISETMEQSEEELSNNKNSKSSKSQKGNSEKMQEMSESMESMMGAQSAQQMQENMEDIQQVLENLVSFSFDQEEILTTQRGLSPRDPRYKEYIVKQKNTQDNFDIIRDSLNAMSSRIPELGPLVNNEITSIYKNLNTVMSEIGDNRRYIVESSQQLVMTSANNLALLLMEMMEQMQQQMQQQMEGEGECNNCKSPGKGKPKGQMRDMQDGLKNQMQDMIDQMKQGGKKPGSQNSEQLAKMLMQQEMMQQMGNDLMNSGISPESAKILQEINRMMEDNLSDIINGKVTQQTINRQQNIMTRLLQAENSEREREIDNKRKSNEAKDYKLSNPDKAFKEKEMEIRFNELLQMSNLKLNSYYKNRYKEYLKNLGQE